MHVRRPQFGDLRDFCCDDCERARRKLARASTVPDIELPGGAAYLAVKAMLKTVTADGELDVSRLHGPALAAWQLAEARAGRGADVDAWLAAVQASRGAARPA